MLSFQRKSLIALAALSFGHVQGLTLDVTSLDSIKSAASSIAGGMVSYYNGTAPGNAIGVLDSPYYWWEGGALFDTLIQYWHLTGDSQYNPLVTSALIAQQGTNSDFLPANQTKAEGNDDQAFWALAAITAAEAQFPPPSGTSWISLAEAVFNEQVARWDTTSCTGGLRWQIFAFNNGYDYKNSASNGLLFQLASRLARYTGNSTYSSWASEIYTWSTNIGLVDARFNVFDGAHTETNCTDIDKVQFSYEAGTYIAGAAYMYNLTSGSAVWKSVLDSLLNTTLTIFFPSGIATEIACEPRDTCTIDMYAYKGILGQNLIATVSLVPYTTSLILPILNTTAQAAAKFCGTGTSCGVIWSGTGTVEGGNGAGSETGLGQQLSALSYVQGLLVGEAATATSTAVSSGADGSETATTGTGTASSTSSGAAASVSKSAGVAVGGERLGLGLITMLIGLVSCVAV